jgi:lysophospholipase L1-like esterase
MIGDSLTELWSIATPEFFNARVLNRGISGQTSGQILLRFMADVIDLAPARVHILCGTNDIGGNTGPSLPIDYERNVRAMVTLARAAGIKVLLASIPPAATMPWRTTARPLVFIPRLNAWLEDLAAREEATFIDYHAHLYDGAGGLRPEYSADGVHVTRSAYRTMLPELMRVLAQ